MQINFIIILSILYLIIFIIYIITFQESFQSQIRQDKFKMNVDIDNFTQIREEIETSKLIEKSQYISFDLEFAGLKFQNNQKDRSSYFPAQKYQKMAAVARKYSIIQIGITFFIRNSTKISAYPYNFYVFPRTSLYNDPTVSLQSGCVSFNTTYKMDWGRWIEKGITYMKLTEYERITQLQQKARSYKELYEYLQEENQDFVDKVIKNTKNLKFKQDQHYLPTNSFFAIKKALEKYFDQKDQLFALKRLQFEEENQDELVYFKITRISPAEKVKNDKKKQQQLYGFTLLFEKIWNSGKPFVGHNSLFDILFMYESFISPLPYDYHLFKQSISQVKQNLKLQMINEQDENKKRVFYDTKLISANINHYIDFLQDKSSLESIQKLFKENNKVGQKIFLDNKYMRYSLENKVLHEAGFDSYLTGWVFYQLMELSKINKIDFRQFAGKVHLNRSYFEMDMLNTTDTVCPYIRVYYIEVARQKDFIQIEYLKKNKSQAMKTIRQIVKNEQLVKDVFVHEGSKQVFIEIKDKRNFGKVTQVLLKYVKKNIIKNMYGLSRFIAERKVKQFIDAGKAQSNNSY